jgi:acetyl-CoA acetyltransferase
MQVVDAASMFRLQDGLGVWEHRGRVAAVGIGHAPTMRRWDGAAETSVGAWSILAIRRAIEDAGVDPKDIDGLSLCEETAVGSVWTADESIGEDFRAAFKQTSNPADGVARLSAEWLLKNMPELENIRLVVTASNCMSAALTAAIQAVGDNLVTTCLALKGWHNFEGRYLHSGPNSEPTVSGPGKWMMAVAGPPVYRVAAQFERYLHKYGKTREMMAPFIVNSRRNGLLFPEGYWAQHRPEPLTAEDYNSARWIAKPANLYDNDLPIHTSGAYVVTTADRARNLRQKPAYVLGHAGAGRVVNGTFLPLRARSSFETLEEVEDESASTGRRVLEAAGVTAADITFENMYDGFPFFHVFHIEGLGFAGIKRGEGLDLFQTDISIDGPNPVSPSGGNIGSGRSRLAMHTDTIQQIQGRAGARSIKAPIVAGISGGWTPNQNTFIVWSPEPG